VLRGPGSSVSKATDYGLDGPGSNQSTTSKQRERLSVCVLMFSLEVQ